MIRALCVGSAECVYEDIKAAEQLFKPDVYVVVNEVGMSFPRVDHWASFHAELFEMWLTRRRRLGLREPGCIWSYHSRTSKPGMLIKPVRGKYWAGSSGLIGLQVCIQEVGATKTVLAGMPMDVRTHFNRTKPWNEAPKYHKAWRTRLPILRDKVRSMSGWTQELLGAPTEEWLNEDTDTASQEEGQSFV